MTGAGSVVALLASAVIVLTGLFALVRAIWLLAQSIRDNSRATKDLGVKFDQFSPLVDARLGRLEDRVSANEARLAVLEAP